MSTQTKGVTETHTLSSTEGVTSNDAQDVFHVYIAADLEMADQFGIEVRSLCGWWVVPGDDEGGPLSGNALPRAVRLCKRCTRTRAYRK